MLRLSRRHTMKTTEPAALKQMANKINFLSISGFAASIFRDIKVKAIESKTKCERVWKFFNLNLRRSRSETKRGERAELSSAF